MSVRLPAVLGFWVMSLCLFRFVSKRSSCLHGFAAMLFPLLSTAYDYAYEARPYGVVLGFSGLSLLCWQLAAENHRRKLFLIGLAVSLAAAAANHYYAVLLFFPLAFGEVIRSLSLRRLDLPIWVAFGSALTPLLLFFPLIAQARTYSAAFWAQPDWKWIPGFYYVVLAPAALPLIAMPILAAVFSITDSNGPNRRNQHSSPMPPFHEIAAAFGLIAIPIVAIIFAKLVTGAFTYRYAMQAIMGFSILLGFSTYRFSNGRAIMGILLVFLSCGWFMILDVKYLQQINEASLAQAKTYELLQSERDRTLPIVVSDAHTFMKLVHYAPPDIVARLVYLADPRASLHHLGHNTIDRGILDLNPWFRLKVEEYGPYIAMQQRFLVYARLRDDRGQVWSLNWLLFELKPDNMLIELRGRNEDDLLFLVTLKG